jgi:uncharacterized surface protein with fasciclin (FAS1) repeats
MKINPHWNNNTMEIPMPLLNASRAAAFAAAIVLSGGIAIGTAGAGDYGKSKTILDTAADAGQFKTLVTAVDAAGLTETLQGKGPFTVFAPTDAAFAKLPDGTVDSLLQPENKEKLVQILTYHVVGSKVGSDAVKAEPTELKTVEGQSLSVVRKDGAVVVNDTAEVVSADVKASNGVIHAIDTVLMPK